MDLGIRGKVAVVAASSKGLGRASAEIFAREGALVTINGRDPNQLERVAAEIRADTGGDVIAIAGDIADPAFPQHLIEETVRRRGGVDMVVCNAGGPPAGGFSAFQEDQPWLDAVNMNLMSMLRLARAAIPYLEQRGGGSITNIVSVSAKQPISYLALSNTARAGVLAAAKTIATEYAPKNIRVNNVLPGSTMTDRIINLAAKRSAETGRPAEDLLKEDAARIPMGRHGTPEEFGNVVVFLASPAAGYVTGTTVQVDGGAVMGLF